MLTDEQSQEIAARAEAATPGPWTPFRCEDDGMPYISSDGEIIFDHREESITFSDSDLSFVCASRTDIPALLAHIKHQKSAMTQMAGAIVRHTDKWGKDIPSVIETAMSASDGVKDAE